jgi:hypothetical protein
MVNRRNISSRKRKRPSGEEEYFLQGSRRNLVERRNISRGSGRALVNSRNIFSRKRKRPSIEEEYFPQGSRRYLVNRRNISSREMEEALRRGGIFLPGSRRDLVNGRNISSRVAEEAYRGEEEYISPGMVKEPW